MGCTNSFSRSTNTGERKTPRLLASVSHAPPFPCQTLLMTQPKPGRVVIMDQDITHAVTAPSVEAGSRPRYSLACKLVIHHRISENADIEKADTRAGKLFIVSPDRSDPIPFGSACADFMPEEVTQQ